MGLIEKTKKEAVEKHLKTQLIIEKMVENGEVINYQTVSAAAGVSRTYLYKHLEFREIIELCRVTGMTKKELQTEVIRLRYQLRKTQM
jgi:hypothetical protein